MHRDPKLSDPSPPGAHTETVAHPSGKETREIELAIFKDHRYSFFYWLKWTKQLRDAGEANSPTLITIDWHRDLAPPSESEQQALDTLNQENLQEIRDFTINQLDSHNDGHLLSAVWLNLIGDVILLKNYGMNQVEKKIDNRDNTHNILEFRDFELFQTEIINRKDRLLYLDIDLDYFIQNKVAPYQRKDVQLYEDDQIRSIINPNNDFFQYLLNHVEGITLATEPRYCGGVRNSNHILKIILDQLFTQEMKWKHLL